MPRVGTSPPRPDGLDKAFGRTRYADDLPVAGLWHGATLRSPHPHARLLGVDVDRGRLPAGAVVVTAADLPGPNGIQLIDDSWPILAEGVVRHVGEPVALVAAPTREQARAALAALTARYAPLEATLTVDQALAAIAAAADPAAAPLSEVELGADAEAVEAALAAAPVVVEGIYETGHQEHIYIECQGMTAWFEDDGTLVAVGSMQCPYYVHKALTHAFDLPSEKVRIRAAAVGGGFGGKEDFPSVIAAHAALLARAAGRPVRIVYDRHEDIVGSTKRHPARIKLRSGVDHDGRLLAVDAELVMDGGAYLTLSSVVLSRGALHASGPYRCPQVRVRAVAVRTHTAPNGAFRGFGAPQTQFAAERHMDRIARTLGLDPVTVRERNLLEPGDRLPTGQVLDPTTSARECLERVVAMTDFRRRWQELETARESRGDGDGTAPWRGIGLSLFFHGAGFTGNGERRMRSPVVARLAADGCVEVLTANTDMGQGCVAIFPQIAADAGGLVPEDVLFPEPDTHLVPDSGPTVASRTTMIVGGTLARAVRELVAQVASWGESELGAPVAVTESVARGSRGELPFRELARRCLASLGEVSVTRRNEPPDWQDFDEQRYRGAAYPTYAWGADVVEVEVDPETLQVRPLDVATVCEVGKAIHPRLCTGQVEGGTLQAVAWGYLEEMKMQDGRYLNDRLATYLIPTAMDAPRMRVELLERPWDGGPFGAKGVGELPMDGGAPAVLAAIENATGVVADSIPATPERLLRWQREGQDVASLRRPPATGAAVARAPEGTR